MKSKLLLWFVVMFLGMPFTAASANTVNPETLSVEDFINVKSYTGKSARSLAFSHNDRYLAYRWNGYNEEGYDLYLYDLKTKTLKRVTSMDRMKSFDTPEDNEKFIKKKEQKEQELARELEMNQAFRDYLKNKNVDIDRFEKEEIEKLKKELEEEKLKKEKEKAEKEAEKEAEKKDKTDDTSLKSDEIKESDGEKKEEKKEEEGKELELWELRDKLKEKKEEDKVKREDLYPGVSSFKWSKTDNELIFGYRGDLFRYFPEEDRLVRLTMTDDREWLIGYTEKSDGCFYSNGKKVFRMMFDSPFLFQINHKLDPEEKFEVADTSVSPDGKWMIVTGSKKSKGDRRKIELIQYDKRFATSKKIPREVPDDKRKQPDYRFYLREIDSANYGKEPEPFFEIKGGDVWYESSDFEWSEQSDRYAFMTWEREKLDLKIWTGRPVPGEKAEVLFEMKENIGYKSFYYNNLKFTPDGKTLVAVLTNEEGFRQPVAFNLETGEKKDIITGKFESFPVLSFSKDSKYMYVISDKLSTAMYSVFKVDLKNGKMELIGKQGGMHDDSAVSHNGRYLATNFANWDIFNELYVMDTRKHTEKILTDSHNKEFLKYKFIQPELFSYKNRHGDIIQGMVFKPEGWKADDKRPSIVYFYGGPLGRSHTVESGNTHRLSYMFQMFMAAKHGYVTVNIDPRGHSGYGTRFNEANFENPGASQTEDLEDLKAFMETGFGVDTNRIGIHGWSFGGYQTQYTMYTSPDTFACGIAAAGPTEWENYNSWYSGATIGKSVRGKTTLKKYSLIPLAKNLRKPLLLVHGVMDPNVLYQDTVNVYRALLESGKETLVDLFLDPEGTHGLGGAVKNKGIFKKYESWFVDKLGEYEQ